MNKVIIPVVAYLLFIVLTASATIINIPTDMPSIQMGINASLDGDTVLVHPGTYTETIVFTGNNVVLASLYLTTGDTSYIDSTIIDGSLSGSVVILENNEDSTAVITGLTIQNGYTFYGGGGIKCNNSSPTISYNKIKHNSAGAGGGIYCIDSNPIITNNTIVGNRSHYLYPLEDGAGGGICCVNSNPLISFNTIMDDSARYGGGIYCDGSSPDIINNTITRDTSTIGGGIYCVNSSPFISDNLINFNAVGNAGGGIYCFQSNPEITLNTIENNYADNNGGGISCIESEPSIIDNTINNNEAALGGGINCKDSANPTITDNTISLNSAVIDGGGIRCINAGPVIYNNDIIENTAGQGSGIFCTGSSNPTISHNFISDNFADNNGGGISVNDSSSPIISFNDISDNSANTKGGGIHCLNSYSIINNNTINNNTAYNGGGIACHSSNPAISKCVIRNNSAYFGGGIFCTEYSAPQISNIVITDNSAMILGGAIVCWDSYPVINNSILWINSAPNDSEISYDSSSVLVILYCDIHGGGFPGDGNMDIDPLFRDPDNNDYHLMAIECDDQFDSPLIDAGNPETEDDSLDCDWGLGTLISDMGAYGGQNGHLDIEQNDTPELPEQISLSQNYPNPFNALTTIQYSLHTQSDVMIDIYDMLGRKVETLFDGRQQAGLHSVIWNANGFSSGVYFYKLTAGDVGQTRKMLLLK